MAVESKIQRQWGLSGGGGAVRLRVWLSQRKSLSRESRVFTPLFAHNFDAVELKKTRLS